MRAPITTKSTSLKSLIWDMLTFEKLLTREVVHLIYWAGLGLLALMAFAIVEVGGFLVPLFGKV